MHFLTDVVSFRANLVDGGGKTTAGPVAGWREISVYRDFNDPVLWDIWRQLEEQGRSTVFQSAAFLRPLLDGVGRLAQAECHILVVTDRRGRWRPFHLYGVAKAQFRCWNLPTSA